MTKSKNFYEELAQRESSNNPQAIEKVHGNYYGLYQMGKEALHDVEYFNVQEDKWTGKDNINSLEDFLNNREIQDKAIKEYHEKIYGRQDFTKFEGKEIGGVKLTKTGITAAAHLVGEGKLKSFLDNNGQGEAPKDGNGVLWSDYAKQFQSSENTPTEVVQQQPEQQVIETPKQPESTQTPVQQPSVPTNASVHEVKEGDTLSGIAQKNNMTVDQLLSISGNDKFKDNPDKINPGDKVSLTKSSTNDIHIATNEGTQLEQEVSQTSQQSIQPNEALNKVTQSPNRKEEVKTTLPEVTPSSTDTSKELLEDLNKINNNAKQNIFALMSTNKAFTTPTSSAVDLTLHNAGINLNSDVNTGGGLGSSIMSQAPNITNSTDSTLHSIEMDLTGNSALGN